MIITIGAKVRAIVVRPYNGHELTIFGVITKITDNGYLIVKPEIGNPITFLISDIGKTVFLVDDNWDEIKSVNEKQITEKNLKVIPNASQAREMSNKNFFDRLNVNLSFITDQINYSIGQGLYGVTIDEYITKEIKDILESQGYKFHFGSQCDAPYTIIKW